VELKNNVLANVGNKVSGSQSICVYSMDTTITFTFTDDTSGEAQITLNMTTNGSCGSTPNTCKKVGTFEIYR
jgi:hypothetical protein